MKRAAAIAVALGVLLAAALKADFKSTFLVDGKQSSSLGYLSPELDDNERERLRGIYKGLGDTHIDLMAWSTARDFPVVDAVGSDWSNQLDTLNSAGLTPVIWLRSDDSPEIDSLPISEQIAHQSRIIKAVDDRSSHYVIALEADEYLSVPEVRVLLQAARKETDKPIAIHLTPGTKGKEEYLKGFDIYYLQTGFNLTEEQFRKEIEYALTLGLPVVVSEYSLNGESAEARRLGDIACSYQGVVGTGNGRGDAVCESLHEEVKIKFVDQYDDELAVFMMALVFMSATYGLKMNLPFKAQFNYIENTSYEVMMAAPVTENVDVGMTMNDRGRVMGFFNLRWKNFRELLPSLKSVEPNKEDRK